MDGLRVLLRLRWETRTRAEDRAAFSALIFRSRTNLKEISWSEVFDISKKNKLAFLHQEGASGGRKSRLVKFVDRG